MAEIHYFEVEVSGRYEEIQEVDEATAEEAVSRLMRDTDQWDGPRCVECGTPLGYSGRGRKPKYCDEHRKAQYDRKNEGTPPVRSIRTAHDTFVRVKVPHISEDSAPMAFRVREMFATEEIRMFDGRLFKPYRLPHRREGLVHVGSLEFPFEVDVSSDSRFSEAGSEEEFEERVVKEYGKYVVIDGVVWKETFEPCYRVVKIGGVRNSAVTVSTGTVENGGELFAADEFESAVEHAADLARELGTVTRVSESNMDALRVIEVVAPEAVSLVAFPPPPKEVRDLRKAYEKASQEIADLRSRLLSLGYAPRAARPYESRHGNGDRDGEA